MSMDVWSKMIRGNDSCLGSQLEGLLPSGYAKDKVDSLLWDTLTDEGTCNELFIDVVMWESWLGDAIEALRNTYLDLDDQ